MATNNKRQAMSVKNYYSIFNIDVNCDLNTIKKAFRKEIAIYHPDNNKREDAKERFNDLVEGFGILSDPEKRKVYDAMLKAAQNNKPMVIEHQKDYKEWKETSEKKSKKYSTTPLEELLLLDIFLDVGLDSMIFGADNLLDGVGDALGDIFDFF